MPGIEGKVVLITGASSGIGKATAQLLAARDAKVVLGARRVDRLEEITHNLTTAGWVARSRKLDVTQLADVQAFAGWAMEQFGQIDVLVNNAGIMPLSAIGLLKVDEWNQMIDVNIRGVLHGIAAVLPIMKQQGQGQVINLSSVSGHRVWHNSSVYSATKFAVRAISEGLRLENRDIRVSIISPGATESELPNTITDANAAAILARSRESIIPADAVARAIAFAIEQPDGVDVNEIVVRPTSNVV